MIRPLGPCLEIGLCTIALFCEKDGHQESFCYRRMRRMHRAHASKSFGVHSLSHGMKTSEPSTRPRFIDGFFDSFSSGFCRDRGHASSASCVGPRLASHDASIGSSRKTLGDVCLLTHGSPRFSSRVVLLRNASKDVSKLHVNQQLHHANPHDKLSTPFMHVTKSWVPKYMLANPSGSKTRVSLSSRV